MGLFVCNDCVYVCVYTFYDELYIIVRGHEEEEEKEGEKEGVLE